MEDNCWYKISFKSSQKFKAHFNDNSLLKQSPQTQDISNLLVSKLYTFSALY